jgi:hypothetical protein
LQIGSGLRFPRSRWTINDATGRIANTSPTFTPASLILCRRLSTVVHSLFTVVLSFSSAVLSFTTVASLRRSPAVAARPLGGRIRMFLLIARARRQPSGLSSFTHSSATPPGRTHFNGYFILLLLLLLLPIYTSTIIHPPTELSRKSFGHLGPGSAIESVETLTLFCSRHNLCSSYRQSARI